MNILFDTNVVLDVLQNRGKFAEAAAQLFSAVEESLINGYLCANSISTIAYLLQRHKDKKFAHKNIGLLLELFEIAPVNRIVIQDALSAGFSDMEDAIVYHSALQVNADGIITRNAKDFKKAKIPVYDPQELLQMLAL